MKAFFADMSLARGIILGSLVLSVILAVTGFKLNQKRMGLDTALAGAAPDLARETQVLSKRYSKLYDEAELEALMESYHNGSGHEVAVLTVPSLGGGALVLDLGCASELSIAASEVGRLQVSSGWVAFERGGHETLVPEHHAIEFDRQRNSTPRRPASSTE